MYKTDITDHYNNNNNTCTNNENNIDIIIPTLIITIPCGLSILCSMSLMVYTLIKHLKNNKTWRNLYTQIIQFVVS